ncbi:MAG: 7TM diverse intracellular signaling domain-containing protein, partial [Venatoribacter sp.]
MLSVYRGLKPNPILLWFFLLFFFPPLSTQAQEPSSQTSYTLNDFLSGTELDYYFTYFEDPSTELTLEEALNQNWQASKQHKMSFGYTNSVYWFRIIIKNNSDEHQDRLLNIDYPVIDYISAYSRVDDGEWALKEYGDKYSFYERDLNHRNFVIPIRFDKQSTMELIFRVQTTSSMQFPVSIWQPSDFFIHDQMQMLILGVYYGLMIVMFLYNLFIFFSVRERSYLFYVLYVASISGFLASLQGLNFQLLWPEATTWNDKSIVFFLGCTVLFAVLFAKYFLELKVIKHFDYALNTIAALSLLIIVASFFTPYHTMIQLLILLTVAYHVIVLVAGIIRWWQGYISARYYVVAWSTLLVGGILMSLSKYNIIPNGILVDNIVQIGSALEVTLLSFALADRFNQEKRQRYEAQQMALEQEKIARRSKEEAFEQERNARIAQEKALQHEREAREAQSKALDIQKQATETLEQRVKERTEELETVNRRLELMS